ncbi:MAG: hypothetical protein ACOX47_12495 [Bacillota bacterium]|jgi:hypothetical protein
MKAVGPVRVSINREIIWCSLKNIIFSDSGKVIIDLLAQGATVSCEAMLQLGSMVDISTFLWKFMNPKYFREVIETIRDVRRVGKEGALRFTILMVMRS